MLINSGHIYRILVEQREAEHLPPQALELWNPNPNPSPTPSPTSTPTPNPTQALELWNAVFKHQVTSPLYLAYILPISRLYLPYISPTSRRL